jgi:GGDEF domain-containing protein
VGGSTTSGLGTLLTTGNAKQALKAAKTSLGPSAIIGGIFGLGASLGQNAWGLLRGSKPLPPEVASAQAKSVSQELARQMGLSAEETGALAQRLEALNVERNPLKRNQMGRALYDDLRFHGARRAAATTPPTTPVETPAGGAVVPVNATEQVGGTLPGEKPVTSPTGAAGGFIGPTLAGRPLRQMSAAELEQARQQAVASGDTATAARAQQGLDLHAKHQAANQPLPLEEAKGYLKDRDRPGNVPIAQARTIASHAAAIEKVNPDLAARLQQAADDYEQTWKNDWLSVGGKVLTTPEAAAPPQVSVWRQLDPTEQSSLPASVKQALLVQDVHNSQQALTPGAPAIFKTADVPGKPKSPKALEATADQMFGQAEAHLDSTLPAPAVETPAAVPMPEPAPAEPAPLPQEPLQPTAPIERRMESGAAQRKAIGEITDLGEARAEIERARAETAESERKRLLHPLTEMPNLSAYNEAPRKAYQGEVDADSLKWWNDEFASEAGDAGGDALLKNVGQALQKAGLESYHIKGDEFVAQGDDPHELAARLELANRILEGSTVQFETLGGETRSFTGAQMTYGVGETLAKGNPYGKANAELKRLKLEKEASGERAARGERPPGVVEVGAKAGAPQGQQELAGRPASGQPDRGVEEGAGAGVEASYNASDLHANPKRGEMPVRFTETESGVPLAVTDKLAAALGKHPKAEVLARYIEENAPRLKAVIDKVIQKALSPEEAARVEQSGLGLLEWNGPAFGANFYDSGNPAGPVAIYVNPFRTEEQVVSRTWYPSRSGGDNPRKLAQDFVNTALHEAAHNLERQEGESHWQVMDRLYDAAGGERTFNPLVEEVQDVITQGNPGGELSPEYRAGRQVYLEATRSAGSARSTDVLRPTAGGRQAPERISPAEYQKVNRFLDSLGEEIAAAQK